MSTLGDEWIVFDQQNQKREVNLEHDQKFDEIHKYIKQLNSQYNTMTDKLSNQERMLQKVQTPVEAFEEMYQQVSLIKNDMININNNITFLLNKVDELDNKFTTLSNNYNENLKKKVIYVHK